MSAAPQFRVIKISFEDLADVLLHWRAGGTIRLPVWQEIPADAVLQNVVADYKERAVQLFFTHPTFKPWLGFYAFEYGYELVEIPLFHPRPNADEARLVTPEPPK